MGRQLDQYRVLDAGGSGRAGRRGARPYQETYSGGQEPYRGAGQQLGRPRLPPALIARQAAEARQRQQDGATLQELADSYNVSKATIPHLAFHTTLRDQNAKPS